ncbi:lipase member H-like [Anoplolepis gracilipes]|uniref:lipase member H-like n=1 Tax=Anoplolepis gracilipes TaxID=354296 RepID=UPI003BA1F4C7
MLTSGVLYLYVLLFFVIKIIYCQTSCNCDQPDSDFATGVNLVYYKCDNETSATIDYPITTPEGLLNVLEDKRVIFYIFGFNQIANDSNVQLMLKALCHGRTDNVVLLDWSRYSNGFYWTCFKNAEKIGSLFARSIQLLVKNGLDVSKIYLIGFSLGAHIAGFVGKCNKFVIPRITGLDPANPLFYLPGCYLKSTDATWIDVIHTDMGGYGTFTFMGTAEYYANGGFPPQPGCKLFGIPLSPRDFCSHERAVELYAKSKRQPKEFIAVKCSSYDDYEENECKNNLHTGIGYNALNVTGTFYFSTGAI